MNAKHKKFAGLGEGTGVYCTSLEFQGLLEIIKEVQKMKLIQVSGNKGIGTITPKKIKTQQDIFLYVCKLAEKHNLPVGFYGINKTKQFIKIKHAKEDDFHDIYSI